MIKDHSKEKIFSFALATANLIPKSCKILMDFYREDNYLRDF